MCLVSKTLKLSGIPVEQCLFIALCLCQIIEKGMGYGNIMILEFCKTVLSRKLAPYPGGGGHSPWFWVPTAKWTPGAVAVG